LAKHSCARGILYESILRQNDLPNGFHTACFAGTTVEDGTPAQQYAMHGQ
jgi:hypothetical protein